VGYHAAYSGNLLLMFQDILFAPSSKVKIPKRKQSLTEVDNLFFWVGVCVCVCVGGGHFPSFNFLKKHNISEAGSVSVSIRPCSV
jgi:hypothetical protein